MELVIIELDTGVELDATECVEVDGAELVDGTNLGNGRGRWIELAQLQQDARVRAGAVPASSTGRIRPATTSRGAQHRTTRVMRASG
jgi:hypothetical protein